MDLSTNYLGLKLRNPLVASASPLCKEPSNIEHMEEVGLSAVVLHSLFEEQIELEGTNLDRFLSGGADSYAESLSYFPDLATYNIGPDGYLEHVHTVKSRVSIPVIGSLNGMTRGGWIRYAKLIEQAGADALELNIYDLPTDPEVSAAAIEHQYVELVREIASSLSIPVAVKIGPYFSSLPHVAREFEHAGAKSLVIFNRFYQPDFDLEALDVVPSLHLSQPGELLLRLHWAAILYARIKIDIAITGGVHTARDVLKAMMAGARVAMTTSALLKHGTPHARTVLADLREWMEENEYHSIAQMQGSMSHASVGDSSAFERGNYMKVLSSYTLRSPSTV